ncbi:MAG: radical SAM protein, partial [Candidatus Brocadiaceae bacterium]|nr:radical SAM protein [Candidatus Brocadiaceae bacterium]
MTINRMASKPLNINFILPYNPRSFLGQVSSSGKASVPRLSLSTLAALTPLEHTAAITDCRNMTIDYDKPIDIAAITALTQEIPKAYEIADRYRAKGVTVVIGGVHASMMPDEALLHADIVIIGEAERSWPKFLLDYQQGNHKRTYDEKERFPLVNMAIP